MKKTLAPLLLAASLGLSTQAFGFGATFQVQESALGGNANLVTANNFNFNYNATFNQTVVGGSLAGVGDTFTETGTYSVGGLFNDALVAPSQLNCVGANCYGLVGSFTAAGEADFFNGVDLAQGVLVTFSSFTLNVFGDTDQNGVGDVNLGSATLVVGQAHVFGTLAAGDFQIAALFTPTAAGNAYFVSPNPFYINMRFDGVNTIITGLDPVNGGPGTIVGSGNAFFNAVPEPGILSLLGIAALGLGFAGRRRSA